MTAVHQPPATLADALEALADQMQAHGTAVNHFALANLMSRVLDGPGSSASRATAHPELMAAMTQAVVPNGFLSPVPDAEYLCRAAAAYR